MNSSTFAITSSEKTGKSCSNKYLCTDSAYMNFLKQKKMLYSTEETPCSEEETNTYDDVFGYASNNNIDLVFIAIGMQLYVNKKHQMSTILKVLKDVPPQKNRELICCKNARADDIVGMLLRSKFATYIRVNSVQTIVNGMEFSDLIINTQVYE